MRFLLSYYHQFQMMVVNCAAVDMVSWEKYSKIFLLYVWEEDTVKSSPVVVSRLAVALPYFSDCSFLVLDTKIVRKHSLAAFNSIYLEHEIREGGICDAPLTC